MNVGEHEAAGGDGEPAGRGRTDRRERLLQLGMEPGGSTPEQLGALIRNDRVKWEKVIKNAGIKAE